LLAAILVLIAAARATPARGQTRRRPDWGTKDRILTHIPFSDFVPFDGDPFVMTLGHGGFGFGMYSTSPGGVAGAVAHVPSGALLTYLELDYFDANDASDVRLNLYDCNYHGLDCQLIDLVQSSQSPGVGLAIADLTSKNYTMDANARELVLTVLTLGGDGRTVFNGAYIGYKLQISPAPPVPTFADVPPDYTYYRAIEALAKSGITGGCGNGNFCPNQFVTRGEMAAFLARALGMHFPN
jgi:hypothetical protein